MGGELVIAAIKDRLVVGWMGMDGINKLLYVFVVIFLDLICYVHFHILTVWIAVAGANVRGKEDSNFVQKGRTVPKRWIEESSSSWGRKAKDYHEERKSWDRA